MEIINKMSEEDYKSVLKSREISFLSYTKLWGPLHEADILAYVKQGRAVATRGVIYFHKSESEDPFAENGEWFSMVQLSKDLARELKKRLSEKLPSYSFEIINGITGLPSEEKKDIESHLPDIDLKPSNFASLKVRREGGYFGNINLYDSVSVDLGDYCGFERRVDRDERVVLQSLREDVMFAAMTLSDALNIMYSNRRVYNKGRPGKVKIVISPNEIEGGESNQQFIDLITKIRRKMK